MPHIRISTGGHSVTHGEARRGQRTKLFCVWQAMRDRCINPRMKNYPYYGGKGVRVCEDWMAYVNFATWARASGYQEGLTIERKDSGGNYEPDNCEWITKSENTKRANARTPRGPDGRLMKRESVCG